MSNVGSFLVGFIIVVWFIIVMGAVVVFFFCVTSEFVALRFGLLN